MLNKLHTDYGEIVSLKRTLYDCTMALINKVKKVYCVFILLTLTVVISMNYGIAPVQEEPNNMPSDTSKYRTNPHSLWKTNLTLKPVSVKAGNLTANVRSRWIVISIAATSKMSVGYVFCVPIVVAAWKRIGWHSIIIVAGDIEHWNNSPLLKLVKQTTLDIDETARFVTIPVNHNPVSYAQVSRSFSTLRADWILPDDIVMTSDVDILPLKREFYDIVTGSEIYVLNADCCFKFSWRDQQIGMQPMTSIGMTVKNWNHVMDLKPLDKNETFTHYVNSWLATHYGKTIPDKDVVKGENEYWYLDQRVVSIQLHNTDIKVNKIRRNTRSDRVDRAFAGTWRDFRRHVDAHMFLDSFQDVQWAKTLELIKDILSEDVVNKLKQFKYSFVNVNTNRS